MLGLGQIVWKIFDAIRYKADPDNHLSRQQIKWLKEKKGIPDYKIKLLYLAKDIHGLLLRKEVKEEFNKETINLQKGNQNNQ